MIFQLHFAADFQLNIHNGTDLAQVSGRKKIAQTRVDLCKL